MGEVYRARDTRLNRTVAIKALHAIVAHDPERVARFEREAQLLASLNHPHIAAIHGIEESGDAKYLVLEFVDGRTLADLIRESGAMPVDDALRIARQIADALAASHERGIIHRDLKPGNVMLTDGGQVKILDFGLGKAIEGDGARGATASAEQSPTMTLAATQAGLILGTAGYMSPEQAKGRAADKRSDVWAFGCVLFELFTGRRAFEGEDITETLAAIVRGEPEWRALPAGVPPAIRTLIERCLIKNRSERLADMSVVRFLLSEPSVLTVPSTTSITPVPAHRGSIRWPLAAGLAAVAVLVTIGITQALAPESTTAGSTNAPHLTIALPDGVEMANTNLMPVAVSPDGQTVAFVGRRAGTPLLFVRTLSNPDVTALAGTDNAHSPFFSPDGQWIAFFAQGRLKKIAVTGAGLQVLSDGAINARGGTWGIDGRIYFAPINISGLVSVSASGGATTEVTRLDRAQGEISHRWPRALADGRTLLFTIWTGPGHDERKIVAQSISNGERRVLVTGGDTAVYFADHLLYTRLDSLFAVPWHPSQGDLGGAVPARMPQHPRVENEGAGAYALSESGTLVYVDGGEARYAQRLVWIDRSGAIVPLPLPERDYESVTISPDGRRAVVQIMEGTASLWMVDFARNTLTPFVTGASSQSPVWTANGQRVIYRGTRAGTRNLYWKAADGTGTEERLTTKENVTQTADSVSPDGAWLVFYDTDGIFGLPLAGDRTPKTLVRTGAADTAASVAPNGKWMAYQSNTSGRWEIYVQPFPEPGPSQLVSTNGGAEPLWSLDGRELFYVNGDTLMAVNVSFTPTFAAGQPRVLHHGRYRASANGNTPYAVAADGRFLRVQQVQPDRAITQLQVVLNWRPTAR